MPPADGEQKFRRTTFKEAYEAALRRKANEAAVGNESFTGQIMPMEQTASADNSVTFAPSPAYAEASRKIDAQVKETQHMENSSGNDFKFRTDKSNLNYRDVFKNVFMQKPSSSATAEESLPKAQGKSGTDLTTKLFSSGYKLRTYSRTNTENYYSMNFIRSTRLNRDCYLVVYALLLIELAAAFLIFGAKFALSEYLAVGGIGLLVPIVPMFIYSLNPEKRIRAEYNFRLSFLNRCMLYLNLLVVVALLGFFGFAADITNISTMIKPIIAPAILLLNLPLSAVVYLALYKTKRYHIA